MFLCVEKRLTFRCSLLLWVTQVLRSMESINAPAEDMYKALGHIEDCIAAHRMCPQGSKISRLIGPLTFFTDLPIKEAFIRMNRKYRITERTQVGVSFNEIRQTFNLAQVLAASKDLRLITFDGDETLYPDGSNLADEHLTDLIISLLRADVHVALVTAAGYGLNPEPYESRLGCLLPKLKQSNLHPEQLTKLYVFGGETNYLFRINEQCQLQNVPYDQWQRFSPLVFTQERDLDEATNMLDVAEHAVNEQIKKLNLRARVIRKERAVGVVPGGPAYFEQAPQGSGSSRIKFEILEEMVAQVREAIRQSGITIPYCAFNGGRDVWVDVGNKAMALAILQSMFAVEPRQCMHIGDQFTESGNDITVRQRSPCIWVINPEETKAILRRILQELHKGDDQADYEPNI